MKIKTVEELEKSIKKLYDLGISDCKFDTDFINKNDYDIRVYAITEKNRYINIKLAFEDELIDFFTGFVEDKDLKKRLEKYFKDWE